MATGIGRATARLFAAQGCRRICLADVNEDGLNKTQELIAAQHHNAATIIVPTGSIQLRFPSVPC